VDLDIEPIRTTGRAAKVVQGEIVRQLNSADLALLDTERGIKAPSLKKLRDSHHAIAKCVAQGLAGTEIAQITGYSQSRISILKADPAFQELVAFYSGKVQNAFEEANIDAAAKLAAVRNDILEELQDRLNDEPEKIPTETLLDGLKVTADRSGFGPASKSTNLNVNIDLADRIAAGRRRVAQLGAPSILPGSDAQPAAVEPSAVRALPPREGEKP